MAGDNFRKRHSGDPFVMKAPLYNALIDAARHTKQNRHDIGQDFQPEFRQASIVRVKNETGSDQSRFACLGIDAPIILPADNENEFSNHVAFRGTTPSDDDHSDGRFVILLEPLAAGVIGKAFAAGVCPAKPLVEDSDAEDYHFADFKDGTTQLIAKSSGPLTILWKETVTGGPGVEAWAVIRFSPGGGQIRQFEMKDTVEEKQWDFDVKGLAYYLEWDEVLGDWKHEAGDPTAEVWGDRFLHGVAFGDDGLAGLGDRVTCWFDKSSDKWWIVEGGQTFIVVNITEPGGILQGQDGAATSSTGDARTIDVMVKASAMDLTESLCYCWWDDAGGGHWDGMQPIQIGCGLKKDDEKRIAFDPTAVAGFGLVPNAGTSGDECKLDVNLTVFAGCGLLVLPPPNPPIINVNNIDLAGKGLIPGAGTCDLDVNVGCGLWINGDVVQVANDDLAGKGLVIGQNECDLDVDIGCGLEFDGNTIKVRTQDIAGAGLEGDLFQPGECFIQVSFPPNCGLAFGAGANLDKLVIDMTEMTGPGITTWTNSWGCVGVQADLGCGLEFDGAGSDGKIKVRPQDIAGAGLEGDLFQPGECMIQVSFPPNCGLAFGSVDGMHSSANLTQGLEQSHLTRKGHFCKGLRSVANNASRLSNSPVSP